MKRGEYEVENLYKVIVALVAVILGSWGLFGWIVKRWIISKDSNEKDIFSRLGNVEKEAGELKAVCEERHKNK